MTYTFYHCGVLVGESDLEAVSPNPRQRAGVFWPTTHGLHVFPRLSGMLAATHALKTHIESSGLCPDELDSDAVEEILDTTPAGQKVLDIGRMLSDVEVHAPDGRWLEFTSIAFSEPAEIRRLAQTLQIDGANELPDLSELPADVPRYIVSVTLCHPIPHPTLEQHFQRCQNVH